MDNVRNFSKGTVIAKADEQSSRDMFVVLQGTVGVYANYSLATEAQAAVLSTGNYYGEMSLFLGHVREHTLVALNDVVVLIINKKTVNDFFSKQTDLAINLVERICAKLDEADKSLALYNLTNSKQTESKKSSLFPENHGQYTLTLNNASELVYEDKLTCPLCAHNFSNVTVIASKLKTESTDKDLRTRFKDIEPLHYDVISCPSCFFSATNTLFPTVSKKFMEQVNTALGPHHLDLYINSGVQRDSFTVFAGYYLAILCAPCFDDYQMITANLWLKLSRLYEDCEDNRMYLYASGKALDDYLYSYRNFRIDGRQMQNMRFIIGDLYFRSGELNLAREFFFMIKSDKSAMPLLVRRADERIEEARVLLKSAKEGA